VRHRNSVFHAVLANVPWSVFDHLVATYEADKHIRQLSTRTQFVALLFGQFAGVGSLHAVVSSFSSHAGRLYHLGVRPVKKSTLADANKLRPSAVFAELFAALVQRSHPRLRREIGECVYLIDATTVRLNNLSQDWARFSAGVCGAKVHVVYDPDADCPIYAAITPERTNDITAAQSMPIQPGATYVFDLGYYDYAWWAKLHAAGCRIVTRFKCNTPLTVETERLIEPGALATSSATILSDRTGFLPARQAKARENPMKHTVREVCIRIETGRILRLLTNDLTASAEEIADLYKRRWAIELFFRWIKQTLKIRHFIGQSENAVRIQIAVALIAFLLLRLAYNAQVAFRSPLRFAEAVRTNLMHRKRLDRLLETDADTEAIPDPKQMALQWG
jgi:hypothetical protein